MIGSSAAPSRRRGRRSPGNAGADSNSGHAARDPWPDENIGDTAASGDPVGDVGADDTPPEHEHDATRHGSGPGPRSGQGCGGFDPGDGLGEFAAELKLLAEAVLERVEPVLRRAAVEGETPRSSCSWCPVCAAAALTRGEQHDVIAAVAEHGAAIVTVLREALSGVPVEPVPPSDDDAATATSHDDPVSHTHTPPDPSTPRGDRTTRRATSSGRTRSRYVSIPVTLET
ncbi:hypothetical protein [Nocardia australiensis]|uniref:hypothetical protein n=1 Tax=Nocardia australiensis TaxID=2887191 RepID=UPI001D151BC8|nr:hypothetical protein [Nocardia australiensis]